MRHNGRRVGRVSLVTIVASCWGRLVAEYEGVIGLEVCSKEGPPSRSAPSCLIACTMYQAMVFL